MASRGRLMWLEKQRKWPYLLLHLIPQHHVSDVFIVRFASFNLCVIQPDVHFVNMVAIKNKTDTKAVDASLWGSLMNLSCYGMNMHMMASLFQKIKMLSLKY